MKTIATIQKAIILLFLVLLSNNNTSFAQDGTPDNSFNANVNDGEVRTMVVQSDGKILVGGAFRRIDNVFLGSFARLNADGTLDTSFSPDYVDNIVNKILVQPDGKVIIAGTFSNVGNVPRNGLARLNTNGTLDLSFNPNVSNSVEDMVLQPDGKIIIVGSFSLVDGFIIEKMARLNTNGSLDFTFGNPNVFGAITSIVLQVNGKVLVGGYFTYIKGAFRHGIARLNANGTLDNTFIPDVTSTSGIQTISLQPDGKIIIGGAFNILDENTRRLVARLNTDGTFDSSFNTQVNSIVLSSDVQIDGKIIIGGSFTLVNNTARNSIARLEVDGTLDASFNPNVSNTVWESQLQKDGKLLIGGWFSTIGGNPYKNFARLNNTVCPTCQSGNYTLTNNPILSCTYQSENQLNSFGKIDSLETVVFKSGQSINLLPNFHAEAGSNFSAIVGESCSSLLKNKNATYPSIHTVDLISNAEVKKFGSRKIAEERVEPNPFSHHTEFKFILLKTLILDISIYNLDGKKVKQILSQQLFEKGKKRVPFNANHLNNGMYLILVRGQDFTSTTKFVVNK